jgi:hypothetical protein
MISESAKDNLAISEFREQGVKRVRVSLIGANTRRFGGIAKNLRHGDDSVKRRTTGIPWRSSHV